jgi:hypothetical protein
LALTLLALPALARGADDPRCGTGTTTTAGLVALHELGDATGGASARSPLPADRDASDVAVLEHRGDLVTRQNPVDLAGRALRFRSVADHYVVSPSSEIFEAAGTALPIGDDGVVSVPLPFAFPFFGTRYGTALVHADGSVAFGADLGGAGDRGLGRLLVGPPRVAPFFADLAPGSSGTVATSRDEDSFAVSWSDVPRAGSAERNSFSVRLHADGGIEFAYGRLETRDVVVGLVPGGATRVTGADLSAGAMSEPGTALVERFAQADSLDLLAAVRRFLGSHPDVFEQVVVYTTRPLNPQPGSLAFQVNVRNEVAGIGLEIQDDSRAWGSGGVLASVVYMVAFVHYLVVYGFEIL